ncbi:MAG: class I SAM-dependent methyltransferase [Dissulfurispiraceae bacterium]|jgi:2-polyprenyl-3-methyl-5-hydroxy-6-metoxy-1,4-benzoquinol methylase|nr:class I SAM-dependent methyltransferase [Dissulfurispiraceae bacterium]
MVDPGYYHKDKAAHAALVEQLYREFPDGVKLPAEYAAFVHKDTARLLIMLARYKFAAKMIRKSDHLLEVGCGSGLGGNFLSQYCMQYTGIDVRTTAIDEARMLSRAKNAEFIAADFFQLKKYNQYDVIVALDVIEHMPVEQGHKLLNTMAGYLKPTGMVIIGTPSIYSYEYQSPLSKTSHVKCYDQQELVEVVNKHFGRTIAFSMNDELVHTGFSKLAWYYFVLGFVPEYSKEEDG